MRDESNQKIEKLQTQVDEEQAQFDDVLAAHISSKAEKETSLVQSHFKLEKELKRVMHDKNELQKEHDRYNIAK